MHSNFNLHCGHSLELEEIDDELLLELLGHSSQLDLRLKSEQDLSWTLLLLAGLDFMPSYPSLEQYSQLKHVTTYLHSQFSSRYPSTVRPLNVAGSQELEEQPYEELLLDELFELLELLE